MPRHPADRRRRRRARASSTAADLAIANFENPAPERVPLPHQGHGLLGRPEADRRARPTPGSTIVSLANNHIRDAGGAGHPRDDQEPQEATGSRSTGAGANLAAARKPAIVDVNGIKVAILGYDTIAAVLRGRTPRRRAAPGSAATVVRADIKKAARRPGPTSSSSIPHWGTEYHADAVRGPADARPGDHRRRRRHGHRQPRPLGRGDGGLQGQADLVRARQLRLRPDLVRADDGGDHPRADVRRGRRSSRSGCGRTSSSTRPSRTSWTRPATGRVVLGQVYDASKGLLPW